MSRSILISSFVILILAITIRAGFDRETHLTYEDSLISFRYAENLADGYGFVYNPGERVLGTTSPLWTFLLAMVRRVGFDDTIANAKILGIVFDLLTIVVLAGTFRRRESDRFALIWAALFLSSSGIVPITTSGMETPLLLFSMAISIRGLKRQHNLFAIGLAMTILTRIDGVLFVLPFLVAACMKDFRWTLRQSAFVAMLIAPWFLFSRFYFGSFLPNSIAAKTTVYDLGLSASAAPFLDRFTPFGTAGMPERAVKTVTFILLGIGTWIACRRTDYLRPLAVYFVLYSVLFATSGGMIFPWYLTPATFSHDILLAAGAATCIRKAGERIGRRAEMFALAVLLVAIVAANVSITRGRLGEYREIQGIEDELRKEIGLWLREHARAGESVFLEPIGYIGYYAGPGIRIIDEIGIVSPPVIEQRKRGDGWYIRSIREQEPDYIVQYTRSLEENIAEGGSSPLFRDDPERAWFLANFRPVGSFAVRGDYPHIADKEKRYTVLRGLK